MHTRWTLGGEALPRVPSPVHVCEWVWWPAQHSRCFSKCYSRTGFVFLPVILFRYWGLAFDWVWACPRPFRALARVHRVVNRVLHVWASAGCQVCFKWTGSGGVNAHVFCNVLERCSFHQVAKYLVKLGASPLVFHIYCMYHQGPLTDLTSYI